MEEERRHGIQYGEVLDKDSRRRITGLSIYYYFFCKRAAYLHLNGFSPLLVSKRNRFVNEGKFISENAFGRFRKEISTDFGKIDVVKREDGKWYVIEVKRSSRTLGPALYQLKFYLWNMLKRGFRGVGVLSIPKERKRIYVKLTKKDVLVLSHALREIEMMKTGQYVPERKKRRACRHCAFFKVCWS